MKKIVLVLVGVLLIGLAGCNRAPEDSRTKIGVVVSTLNNPFFVSLKSGAELAAKIYGYNLIVLDSQNDPAKELSNVEDLITKGVKVLLINPTDSDSVITAVEKANDKNIPVIMLDRDSNGGKIASYVASDNEAGGKMAGEYIIKKLGKSAKIVELEGIPGTTAARERGKGFEEAVKGMDIVSKQTADFDRAKGLKVMENILQSHPNVDAVFAQNDEMALGALEVVKTVNRKILVVGFDATDDAVKAVENGELAATVAQQPKLIGKKGLEIVYKILHDQKVDKYYPIELKLITK